MRKMAREGVIFALLGQLLATVVGFVRLDMDDRATARNKAAQAVHAEMPKTMVPMFAPDGTLGDIPAERVNDAVKAGGKLALVEVPLTNGTVLHVRGCEPPIDLSAGLVPKKDNPPRQKNDNGEGTLAEYMAMLEITTKNGISSRDLAAKLKEWYPVLSKYTDDSVVNAFLDKNPKFRPRVKFDAPIDNDCVRFDGQEPVTLGTAKQVAIEKEYWAAYKNSRDMGGCALWSSVMGLWGFAGGLVLWFFYRLVRFAVRG